MSGLGASCLISAMLLPAVAAAVIWRMRSPARAHGWAVVASATTLVLTVIAAADYWLGGARIPFAARGDWPQVGTDWFLVNELNAPLLPLTALIFWAAALTTVRTKTARFSFAQVLLAESVMLAMFCAVSDWAVVAFINLGWLFPYLNLRSRKRPTRVLVLYAAASIALLSLGWYCSAPAKQANALAGSWAVLPLLLGVAIRAGIAPFHCWVTDLFEHGAFGASLVTVAPMPAAYAAAGLLLSVAPDWMLHALAYLSLATSVYAAGMALVQTEARRFFCFLFLSYSALVMTGLALHTAISLAGALCAWLSVSISLTGFGLTLRAVEARIGRISLMTHHGLQPHAPILASFFLLMGLASAGFPGTIGFIATELLVDGAVRFDLIVGLIVVVATGLNGIAVLRTCFVLFGGARPITVDLSSRKRERFAITAFILLTLGGGLLPQPGVSDRSRIAVRLDAERRARRSLPVKADFAVSNGRSADFLVKMRTK